MHILLVHRYYWPDTPAYAAMLHIMAKHLVKSGHKVSVFSTQPCYNGVYLDEASPAYEVVDGVEIYRTPLLRESKKKPIIRAINVGLFCVSLLLHCLLRFRKYNVMTVSSFPPVVMGMMARIICFFSRMKYLYHCQDLYPEVALNSGVMRSKWVAAITARIDRRNCQKAQHVVVLSQDMLDTVVKRGVSKDHIRVINNFTIASFDNQIRPPADLELEKGKFRVLFAGNLGRFQNLSAVMEAAEQMKDQNEIQFWFVGDGAMKKELEKQAVDMRDRTVFFRPFLPMKQVMAVIADSHLSIVSLSPGVIECAYPSKTMTYLEAGCRLLVLVEPSSSLARFVRDNEIGSVCEDYSAASIVAAVTTEFTNWKGGQIDRQAIQQLGADNFSQKATLSRWDDLLEEIRPL